MHTGFTIERPSELDEALEILAQGDESTRPLGGGSGLTLLLRYGFFEPETLVSLDRLPGLREVERDGDGTLVIGACNTLRDLEDSAVVADRAPVLKQALRGLATVRLRNIAQVGGAVAHGHPQMDLPPVLLALGARFRVMSVRGSRWIDADEFFLGYYETGLEDDELLTEVVVPDQGTHRGVYRKVTARTVDDWPMLGVAVVAREKADGREARIAVGAVTDRAHRLTEAEAALRDAPRTAAALRTVAEGAAAEVECHDGPNGSAAYQRHRLGVELRKAFEATLLNGAIAEGR